MWKYDEPLYVVMHGENKKHKYIAKLDLPKYKRYFYTLAEYRAYLNKKKPKVDNTKNKIKAALNKAVNFIKKTVNKTSKTPVSKVKISDKTESFISKCLKEFGLEKISNVVGEKNHKYLYKEKIGFGKYRYFYDEKSHKVWLKKQQYIENEPDFMKNIPKTKDMTDVDAPVLMSSDNQKITNKGWDNQDLYTTNNCFFCTTAYELRQRGYDVVAKQSQDGTYGNEAYNIFKDPKITTFSKNVEDNPEELKRQMIDISGPGSRGNICIKFKPYGGGHSMAYEISPDGKEVVIVDAQTNENFSLAYIASLIDTEPKSSKEDSSMFFRTDNLELKKAVLNLVQPADTSAKIVVGYQDSISDRKTQSVIGLASKTMDNFKEYFDSNGNPTKSIDAIYPEGYDEARIKVTWG